MSAASREVLMTQEIIDGWARISGDLNPLHVDTEYARSTPFGGTIAHGHLALAYLEGLMLDLVGETWLSGGHLEGTRFRAPIRPGSTFVVSAEPSEGEDPSWALTVTEAVAGTVCVTARARLTAEGGR